MKLFHLPTTESVCVGVRVYVRVRVRVGVGVCAAYGSTVTSVRNETWASCMWSNRVCIFSRGKLRHSIEPADRPTWAFTESRSALRLIRGCGVCGVELFACLTSSTVLFLLPLTTSVPVSSRHLHSYKDGSLRLGRSIQPPTMADDDSKGSAAEASCSPSSVDSSCQAAHTVDDRSQILAQATRFLTSANISESASEQDKREFLRTKGLTEDEITRAFNDAASPVARRDRHQTTTNQPWTGDMDPFDIAARQFDDPINADALVPPPKSYPNTPLALYYDPPTAHSAQPVRTTNHAQDASASPLTRYQVLLQFFRTLSYMMMLSGGLTAIVVSSYRAYILPKITAMFHARSIVLKHHIVLFDKLRSNVASLAMYAPIQHARISAEQNGTAANAGLPLKGVLKKVHFHDEVDAASEKEGVKSTQHGSGNEKVVMPSTDVVVDAKTPLLSEVEASEEGSTGKDEGVEAAFGKHESIDVMTPIRESMARLAEALKGGLSGRPTATVSNDARPPSATTTSSSRGARAATVTDADSGSDSWEDDSSDAASADDDDDGLEFDPYGAYQKKHKHTQSSSSSFTTASDGGSESASICDLKAALVSLNADISTHAFASSTSLSSGGGAFRFGPGTTDTNASGAESPKSGDLGQVKAEIRSLKGLLLSRRNFPSYAARPPPLPASAMGDARSGSAIV